MKRAAVKQLSNPVEFALVGDLTAHESDLTEKLLAVPVGGSCTFYIDSPGGSPYSALSLATIILLRKLRCTAFVTGECSSATLWPFAACVKRYVTPSSVMLFHAMKWQSEEHVELHEAAEWARHFGKLEQDMDVLLCDLFQKAREQICSWVKGGRYVTGPELVEAGLAELIPFSSLITNLRKMQAEQQGLSVHKPTRNKRAAR
jgi:ATP-dependent Clp protease, protease subunit